MRALRALVAGALGLAVALTVSAVPAQAYVNLSSTGSCALDGTTWATKVYYHRDSGPGSVQSYAANVTRQSGSGTLTLADFWWDYPSPDVRLDSWSTSPSKTTTGDINFSTLPSWQLSQTVRFVLTSPSSAGQRTSTCLVTVT